MRMVGETALYLEGRECSRVHRLVDEHTDRLWDLWYSRPRDMAGGPDPALSVLLDSLDILRADRWLQSRFEEVREAALAVAHSSSEEPVRKVAADLAGALEGVVTGSVRIGDLSLPLVSWLDDAFGSIWVKVKPCEILISGIAPEDVGRLDALLESVQRGDARFLVAPMKGAVGVRFAGDTWLGAARTRLPAVSWSRAVRTPQGPR